MLTLGPDGSFSWFWSADLVDVLDLVAPEPKNAIV